MADENMPNVMLAVEGDTDIPFARKLLNAAGLDVSRIVDSGGKDQLDLQLTGYNAAAQYGGWFILRDLDQDAVCAVSLRRRLLPEPAPLMCFRIPVRALESWVLGDSERLASFLSIREGAIPLAPEEAADPKQTLVTLARKSTKKIMRRDFVPPSGAKRKVGPGYEARLIEFGENHWRWDEAATRCPSLKRCVSALCRLKKELTP